MMAFFDSLVQREIEGWDSSSEDESGGDGGLRSDLSSGSDSDSSSSSEPDSSSRLAGALSSPGREEVFSGGSPAPAASHSQGTQTPVQSPQNIISDLIARKRGQLLRRARGREGMVEAPSISVSGPAPA